MDTQSAPSYVPPPAPVFTPVPQTPHVSGSHTGAVATVVIAVLLIGGYLVWASSTDSGPFAPSEPVASESPSPSVSAEPMADWKTYTNSEFGFQLTFPDSWEGYRLERKALQRSDFPSGAPFDTEYEKQKGMVTFQFATRDAENWIFAVTAYPKTFWSTVADEPLFASSYLGEKGEFVFSKSTAQDSSVEFLTPARQILSTFKFTDTADPMAGWKTYTFADFEFTIKLSDTWTSRKAANVIYFQKNGTSEANIYVEKSSAANLDVAAQVLKQRFETPLNASIQRTTTITEVDDDTIRLGRISRRVTTTWVGSTGIRTTLTGFAMQTQTGFLLIATSYESSDPALNTAAQESNLVLTTVKSSSPAQ